MQAILQCLHIVSFLCNIIERIPLRLFISCSKFNKLQDQPFIMQQFYLFQPNYFYVFSKAFSYLIL